MVLIWARLGVHNGKLVAKLCRRVPRLHVDLLPAYAPELNPDEGVWQMTKRRLANNCPAVRIDLALDVLRELEALRREPRRLWSCIKHSRLRL